MQIVCVLCPEDSELLCRLRAFSVPRTQNCYVDCVRSLCPRTQNCNEDCVRSLCRGLRNCYVDCVRFLCRSDFQDQLLCRLCAFSVQRTQNCYVDCVRSLCR